MRPDIDLYFMRMAHLVATRSTCLRRSVGCVLVNGRRHVLSTGYNGVARGSPHCNEMKLVGETFEDLGNGMMRPVTMAESYPNKCAGAMAKSGTKLHQCTAVHAEQNALLQCRDVHLIDTAYVTTAPCDSCLKLFLNTSCERLIIGAWYATSDGSNNEAQLRARWDPRLVVLEKRV